MSLKSAPADAEEMPSLFNSFWLGGFESACHINGSGKRLDMIAVTQHDVQVERDYARVGETGISSVREAVRWHLIEHGGKFDFSSLAPMLSQPIPRACGELDLAPLRLAARHRYIRARIYRSFCALLPRDGALRQRPQRRHPVLYSDQRNFISHMGDPYRRHVSLRQRLRGSRSPVATATCARRHCRV